MKIFLLGLAMIFLGGCTINDPYDPLMGPRNPRPGAEKYLLNRNDISEAQKTALLSFQACSRETLHVLVDAPSREVRSLIAGNPSADESILEKLVHDKESGVRQYIAGNQKAPVSILLKLQKDENENVKWSLEHNPSWKSPLTGSKSDQ